jgi:hypothetical protein
MNGILTALVVATTLPAPMAAQPPPQHVLGDPMAHRHDRGFLLRLDVGVGYMNSSIDTQPSMAVKGAGPEFGLVVGGPIHDNLILGGHLWIMGSLSPTLEQGSVSVGTNSDTSNTLVALGPNVTYYIMPANVYFSVTPALTRLSLTTNQGSGTSDAGFGMHFAVAKEWWVAERWGLGVAAQFMFSSNDDRNDGPKISTLAGGLAMSVTFN